MLLRNEYLSAENRILIQQLQGRLYGQKILNTCWPSARSATVYGRALGSCSPGAAAAHAGLAAVAVNAVVLTWELAQMDILTMRATTYTGFMAAGEKLSTKTANPKAWVLVMPQTDSETVFETVCTQ